MKKISSLFDKALKDKETKGYKYIYVLVDLEFITLFYIIYSP